LSDSMKLIVLNYVTIIRKVFR